MNALTTQKKDKQEHPVAPQTEYIAPDVDIWETEDGYLLEADMPGVTKSGLEITLEGNVLTMTGHRQHQALPGEVVLRESRPVDFRRVFELDPAIETNRINARMDNGVLVLELPKQEQVKPRMIKVE